MRSSTPLLLILSVIIVGLASTVVAIPPAVTDVNGVVSLAEGENLSYTITNTGGAIDTYEWRKDSVALTNGGSISGATGPTLTITGVTQGDEGNYTCYVSNVDGNDETTAKELDVLSIDTDLILLTAALTPGTSLHSFSPVFVNPSSDSVFSLKVTADTIDVDLDLEASPGASITLSGSDGTSVAAANPTSVLHASIASTVTLTVTIIPEAGSSYQRVVTVTIQKQSTESRLSSLSFANAVVPIASFQQDVTTYTIETGYDTTSVTPVYTTEHGGATVTVSGETGHVIGDNTVTLLVTSANGLLTNDPSDKTTYTITVHRQDNVATLSSLTRALAGGAEAQGTIGPVFNPSTYTYNLVVTWETVAVTLVATSTDSIAHIDIDADHDNGAQTWSADDTGSALVTISITPLGDTDVTITVSAEDRSKQQVYTVLVRRSPPVWYPEYKTGAANCPVEYFGTGCLCYKSASGLDAHEPTSLDLIETSIDSNNLVIVVKEPIFYKREDEFVPDVVLTDDNGVEDTESQTKCYDHISWTVSEPTSTDVNDCSAREWRGTIAVNKAINGTDGCTHVATTNGEGDTEIKFNFALRNFEIVELIDGNNQGTGEYNEREVLHLMPFTLIFPSQITVTTGDVQVFSDVATARAIVRQVITSSTVGGVPTAFVSLFVASQYPYELHSPVGGASLPGAYSYGPWADDTDANTEYGYTCDNVLNQDCLRQFKWSIIDSNLLCTFSGSFSVVFDVKCVDGYANCPLTGSEEVTVVFGLTSVANHCPQVVDEVILEKSLDSYKDPTFTTPKTNFIADQTVYFQAKIRSDDVALSAATWNSLQIVSDVLSGPIDLMTAGSIVAPTAFFFGKDDSSQGEVTTNPDVSTSYLLPSFQLIMDEDQLAIPTRSRATLTFTGTIDITYEATFATSSVGDVLVPIMHTAKREVPWKVTKRSVGITASSVRDGSNPHLSSRYTTQGVYRPMATASTSNTLASQIEMDSTVDEEPPTQTVSSSGGGVNTAHLLLVALGMMAVMAMALAVYTVSNRNSRREAARRRRQKRRRRRRRAGLPPDSDDSDNSDSDSLYDDYTHAAPRPAPTFHVDFNATMNAVSDMSDLESSGIFMFRNFGTDSPTSSFETSLPPTPHAGSVVTQPPTPANGNRFPSAPSNVGSRGSKRSRSRSKPRGQQRAC